MKKLLLFLLLCCAFHVDSYAYAGILDVNVGATFTLNGGSYRYIQAVLWDYDKAVFETVSVSGYSTSGKFKAISPATKGSIIQATIYYYKNGTTSSGVNKDVLAWKIYVADDGSESTVSLPNPIEITAGQTKTITATPGNSKYSGSYKWTTSNSLIVEVVSSDKNKATLRGKKEGSAYIYVTLDNGNKDSAYVKVLSGSTSDDVTAEVVDLGLSVKWTTCNLGASTPTGFGNTYAWGATKPSNSTSDDSPGLKWCTETSLENAGVIKNGHFTPEYDACTQALGAKYRVPTIEEWQELSDNCTWVAQTISGVPCLKGTSKKNGKTIILPRTLAMYVGTSIECHALTAWSCTHYYNNSPRAYYAWANIMKDGPRDGFVCTLYDGASRCRTLRAVYDPSGGVEDVIKDVNICDENEPANVYNLQGICVRRNAISLDGLPSGIYIYKGRKVRL